MKYFEADRRMPPKALAALALAAILSGCGGGGGGGGGGGVNIPVNGQSAAITAAQSAVVYAGGQSGLAAEPQMAQVGGNTALIPRNVRIIKGAVSAFLSKTSTSSQWTEVGETGVYYEIGQQTNTSGQILFSTDGVTNNAGYMNVRLLSGSVGVYPETVGLKLDLILSNQTIVGSDTLTVDDDLGDNFNLKGTESSSTSGVSVSFNITGQNGQITASMSSTKSGITVAFSDIVGNSSGFSANFSVGDVTGTVSVAPDGSGNGQAVDSSGTWTISWDSSQNATLTSPSGQVTTGKLGTLQM